MDFHALPRRDLQALAKRNGIRANMSNVAMADALAALPAVDGVEEYVQQSVDEPTPAAEPEVHAAAEGEKEPAAEEEEEEEEEETEAPEEKEEEEEPEKQEISPHEVILLDDSEEEDKDLMPDQDEEKASALGVGRRRATRRTRVEPVAAPATRKKAAANKAEKGDAAVEAVPARATRARSQRTVSWAEDEEQFVEAAIDAQNEEQFVAAEAVPARATRARSQRPVLSAAEEASKTRRTTSRRAAARKTGTEQEEEEKGTHGDVSETEATIAAPVLSDEGGNGAAQKEEQNAPVEEQSQGDEGETDKAEAAKEAVPTRATRARSQRTVSWAEDEAPKARRTSRRAVAKRTSTEQEDEGKGAPGDVSDMEVPVSSDEGGDAAAQNEEQNAPVEEQSQEDEGETDKEDAAAAAVPARATRARSHLTGASAAAEEAPKARRTSRRAAARKTSTEQEEEEKATQGDVSGTEAAVPAPVSSDEGGHDAEEMEAPIDAQKKEQFAAAEAEKEDAAAEAVPARATRARRQRTVVSPAEEEAPKARRTSRRTAARKTSTEQEEEEKATQGGVSDVEAAVPAPVSSDEGDAVAEEMEAAIDVQNEEQNEQVEEHGQQEKGVVVDIPAPVEEEPPVAEDCMVDSSVEEQLVDVHQCEDSPVVLGLAEQEEGSGTFQNDAVSSEGIHHASEDTEMLQTPLKSSEATEEVEFTSNVGHASEEKEVRTSEEVLRSADKAIDEHEDMAAEVVTNSTDVSVEDMASEENEVCRVEEESPVAEDADSSVQEPLVDVQQCEATEQIEDTEMVPVLESSEATEEVDCISDVGEENEDCTVEQEPPVAEHVDSSVQEPLVDVQQCEATEVIQLAGEDTKMVPVNEVPTEEVVFTSDVAHASEEIEVPISEEVLHSADKATEEQEDIAADEVPHNTDEYVAEEAVVATDEMPQRMDEGAGEDAVDNLLQATVTEEEGAVKEVVTIDNLSQATVTDEEGAVRESGFGCDLTDVSVEEDGVVPADEMPQMSVAMDEGVVEVVNVDSLSQATVPDDEGVAKESGDVSSEKEAAVATDEIPQSSATMDENVEEEMVTVENLSQATVTDDEGSVKQSGSTTDLADVSVEEDAVVAADETPQRSLAMHKSDEELVTVDDLSQAILTDEEGAVDESVFSCGLAVLSADEEAVMAVDEMQLSSATMKNSVEEVVTVDNLSQATITDDEWAVTESVFTGDCTPVVGTATDFSDHIASPLSLNVFEDATKSLSMDSNTEPMVSEPADVAVQRENEVKEGNESVAAVGRIIHSPLSIRKLRMAVAQENEADGVPLLSIRKQRMAVAQENEADGVHLCIFSSSGGEENSAEPVAVEREKEVKEGEAFGKIIHSPLSIRKLRMAVAQENEADGVPLLSIRKPRMAVAQENEADGVPLCIFSSSGGEENSAEPVAVEREKDVKEGEKSSVPLEKLSLGKLRIKLKETLNARKNLEPKRVPLGRLDENAC